MQIRHCISFAIRWFPVRIVSFFFWPPARFHSSPPLLPERSFGCRTGAARSWRELSAGRPGRDSSARGIGIWSFPSCVLSPPLPWLPTGPAGDQEPFRTKALRGVLGREDSALLSAELQASSAARAGRKQQLPRQLCGPEAPGVWSPRCASTQFASRCRPTAAGCF